MVCRVEFVNFHQGLYAQRNRSGGIGACKVEADVAQVLVVFRLKVRQHGHEALVNEVP